MSLEIPEPKPKHNPARMFPDWCYGEDGVLIKDLMERWYRGLGPEKEESCPSPVSSA